MTKADLQNIKNRLKLFILNHDDVNHTTLAEFFLKSNSDVKLSERSVRRYISMVKDAESDLDADINDLTDQDEIVPAGQVATQFVINFDEPLYPMNTATEENSNNETDVIPEKESIEELKDLIELKYNNTIYPFSRDILDKVFCAFSKKGSDLTSGAIQNILNISADEFKAITGRLGLSKDSKPYSKYSEDLLTDAQLWEEYEKNIAFLLESSESNNVDAQTKFYKKYYLANRDRDFKFSAQVEGLRALLPIIKFDRLIENKECVRPFPGHIHLIIPDMHIGINQGNYNYSIIQEQLNHILSFLVLPSLIHVHFLGDIIHSVSGLNHQDTWKNMDPNATGAEAIIQPYKLLSEFLGSIKGLYSVDIVGGNHGRIQSSKDQENTAEGEKLISFMLSQTLSGIPVNFDSNMIIDDSDPKLTFVSIHGDKPIDKGSGQSFALNYGDSSKFTYIAMGHNHTRELKKSDDGLKFRKEGFPAFCPADNYSKTFAHGSLPGFKMVHVDDLGMPIVSDISLKYN